MLINSHKAWLTNKRQKRKKDPKQKPVKKQANNPADQSKQIDGAPAQA